MMHVRLNRLSKIKVNIILPSTGEKVKKYGHSARLLSLVKNIKDGTYRWMVKRYKRIIYTFEHSIEVYEYLDGKYGARGEKRGKKKKITPEAIRYRNQWNRERKARHKLKTWFHENDYLVLLTYKKDKRPPDMETAKKHLAQAMRKVREKYKKAGKKMRWMANIEVGTKGAWHVHVVINRIPDADIIIKDAWGHGTVTFKHLYEAGDFKDLAGYITKTPETCERYGEHLKETSYHASRNMPLKEPEEERFVQWRKAPEKKGYYLDKETYHEGTNKFTGYKYRYYTLVKLDRRI